MSLSRREGLRCQNVTFCPLCARGEPQLSLHLLFWPFGSLKEKLLSGDFLCFPAERRVLRLFLLRLFEVLFHEADKRASSGGILNENKNQLGHGLVTIRGAAVWKSEKLHEMIAEVSKKAHTN